MANGVGHDNVLILQHFGSLLYVRSRHEYIPYDRITTDVLLALTLRPMKALPTYLAGQIPQKKRNAFLKSGRRSGFIDKAGRFKGRVIDQSCPEDRLVAPLTVHLAITNRCNLSCRHCFAQDEMKGPVTEMDPAIVFQQFGCTAGNTVATVYANGDVSPCSLIGDGVELDNLHDKTFREIWHDGVGFRHIRNIRPPTACIECTAYESCAGGCRARAYQANNSLSAIDPWCTLAT